MPRKRYVDKKHSHLSIGPVLFLPCFDEATERWGSAFETDDARLQVLVEKSGAFAGLTVEVVGDEGSGPPKRGELRRMNKRELQKLLVGLGGLLPKEATKAQLVDLIVGFKPPEQAKEAGKEE